MICLVQFWAVITLQLITLQLYYSVVSFLMSKNMHTIISHSMENEWPFGVKDDCLLSFWAVCHSSTNYPTVRLQN